MRIIQYVGSQMVNKLLKRNGGKDILKQALRDMFIKLLTPTT